MGDRTISKAVPVPATPAASAVGPQPYAASWVNRLIDWLGRLPGPAWLPYVLGFLAAVGLEIVVQGSEPQPGTGAGAASVLFAVLYYGALPLAVIGLIARLDTTAERALTTLRPRLRLTQEEANAVLTQLTVIPARPALMLTGLSFVLTAASLALDPAGSGIVGLSIPAIAFRWLWEGLVTACFLVLIYHTVRQLRLIGRLHESLTGIDAFDQAPLYALSSVTSTTAVGLVLLLVPSVFLIPSEAGASYLLLTAAWYVFALAIAAGAFFLPLRGIHERLDAEKARLKGETGRRLSATLEAIHRAVDAGDAAALANAQQALSTLTAERDLVAKIPTWPWSAGALTRFLSAVLLPIGLWLITRVLERLI